MKITLGQIESDFGGRYREILETVFGERPAQALDAKEENPEDREVTQTKLLQLVQLLLERHKTECFNYYHNGDFHSINSLFLDTLDWASQARSILTEILKGFYINPIDICAEEDEQTKIIDRIFKGLLLSEHFHVIHFEEISILSKQNEESLLFLKKIANEYKGDNEAKAATNAVFELMQDQWHNPTLGPYAIFHSAMIFNENYGYDHTRQQLIDVFNKLAINSPAIFDDLSLKENKPELIFKYLNDDVKNIVTQRWYLRQSRSDNEQFLIEDKLPSDVANIVLSYMENKPQVKSSLADSTRREEGAEKEHRFFNKEKEDTSAEKTTDKKQRRKSI